MGKDKKKFTDDGRVIASMNVDGMPWYVPKTKMSGKNEQTGSGNTAGSDAVQGISRAPVNMTRSETLAFTWGVLKAALLAASVFIGALFAFIMFCIHVWFR